VFGLLIGRMIGRNARPPGWVQVDGSVMIDCRLYPPTRWPYADPRSPIVSQHKRPDPYLRRGASPSNQSAYGELRAMWRL
jgi:hypothetical protein